MSREFPTTDEARVLDDVGIKLMQAALIIRTNGHAKHFQCDPMTGGYCVHGAINKAFGRFIGAHFWPWEIEEICKG